MCVPSSCAWSASANASSSSPPLPGYLENTRPVTRALTRHLGCSAQGELLPAVNSAEWPLLVQQLPASGHVVRRSGHTVPATLPSTSVGAALHSASPLDPVVVLGRCQAQQGRRVQLPSRYCCGLLGGRECLSRTERCFDAEEEHAPCARNGLQCFQNGWIGQGLAPSSMDVRQILAPMLSSGSFLQTAKVKLEPGATGHQVQADWPVVPHGADGPRQMRPSRASSGRRRPSMWRSRPVKFERCRLLWPGCRTTAASALACCTA